MTDLIRTTNKAAAVAWSTGLPFGPVHDVLDAAASLPSTPEGPSVADWLIGPEPPARTTFLARAARLEDTLRTLRAMLTDSEP